MTDLEKVKAIILDASEYPSENLPQSTRAMLADGLPHALSSSNEIHAFQKEFADCIKKALSEIKEAAETAVCIAGDAVHETEEQLKSLQVNQEDAANSHNNARSEITAKTEACNSAQTKANMTKAEHALAKQSETSLQEQLQKLQDRKAEVDALLISMQKFENSGGTEALDIEGLMKYLTDAGVESTLLAAVPSAIQVPPSARGKFDSLTWAEVRKIIECDVAKLDMELDPKVKEMRYVASEVLGLWTIHDVAHDGMLEATINLNKSKNVAEETKKALFAAGAEVDLKKVALSTASLQHTLTRKKVQELDEALVAFEQLRCPPQEEVPASAPSQGEEMVV